MHFVSGDSGGLVVKGLSVYIGTGFKYHCPLVVSMSKTPDSTVKIKEGVALSPLKNC